MRLNIPHPKLMAVCLLICLLQGAAVWAADKTLTYPGLPSTAWQSGIDQNGNVTVTVNYNTWKNYCNDQMWHGNTLFIKGISKLIITGSSGQELTGGGIKLECDAAISFAGGTIVAYPNSNFYGKVEANTLKINNDPAGVATFHAAVEVNNSVDVDNTVIFKSSLKAASLKTLTNGNGATFEGTVNISGSISISDYATFKSTVSAASLTVESATSGAIVTFENPVNISGPTIISNQTIFKNTLTTVSIDATSSGSKAAFEGTVTASGNVNINTNTSFGNNLMVGGQLHVTNSGNSQASFGGNVSVTGDVKIENKAVFNGTFQTSGNLEITNSGNSDAMFNKDAIVAGTATISNDIVFKQNFIAKDVVISGEDASKGLCRSLASNGVLDTDQISFNVIWATWKSFTVKIIGSSYKIYQNGTEVTAAQLELSGDAKTCLDNLIKSVLPTYLSAVRAIREGHAVRLLWNADRPIFYTFQIERSTDGITFLPLARLQGALSYLDESAPVTLSWYRIRLEFPNGTYLYSAPVEAPKAKETGFIVCVSPNPLQGGKLQTYIRSATPLSKLQLRLTDLQGRLLGEQTLRTDAGGQGQWSVDIATSIGMLLLQATDGKNAQTVKVLVQ